MIARNLWEADQLRRLTTVALVDAELARCTRGAAAAPTPAKYNEWQRKLAFLRRLKIHLTETAPETPTTTQA
jgi:hypothetical protein